MQMGPANVGLTTAGGDVEVRESASVRIPGIGRVQQALTLDDTPNCCSLGELVEEQNHEVHWKKQDFKLVKPDGSVLQVPVPNKIPLLIPDTNQPGGVVESGSDNPQNAFAAAAYTIRHLEPAAVEQMMGDFLAFFQAYKMEQEVEQVMASTG